MLIFCIHSHEGQYGETWYITSYTYTQECWSSWSLFTGMFTSIPLLPPRWVFASWNQFFFFRLLKASGVNYIVHTDRWGYERCCIWWAAWVPPKTYCKEKVSSKFTMWLLLWECVAKLVDTLASFVFLILYSLVIFKMMLKVTRYQINLTGDKSNLCIHNHIWGTKVIQTNW